MGSTLNLMPAALVCESKMNGFQKTKDKRTLVGFGSVQPIPVLGLHRDEAARFIGVSPSKFDEMVKDGRMPTPKRIDFRRVWDIRQLEKYFDRLPGGDDQVRNAWDEVA